MQYNYKTMIGISFKLFKFCSSLPFAGLLKINDHFQSVSSAEAAAAAAGVSHPNAASTIKIRNLAHLLQQLDELGQPISSTNSADDADTDRHLYGVTGGGGGGGGGGSHLGGSSSGRSITSAEQISRPGEGGRRGGGSNSGGGGGGGICPRHNIAPALSLDSQLVEQDLAYLLAGTGNAGVGPDSSQAFRARPSRASITSGSRIGMPPMSAVQRFAGKSVMIDIKTNFCIFIYRNTRGSGQMGPSGGVGGPGLGNHYQTPTPSYFATLPPLSPSTTTSTTTSTAREGHEDEAEEYDYEENGSAFDSDLNADLNSGYSGNGGGNGSQQSGCQLTRSASEEALPVRAPFYILHLLSLLLLLLLLLFTTPYYCYFYAILDFAYFENPFDADELTNFFSFFSVGFTAFEQAILTYTSTTAAFPAADAAVSPTSAAAAAHSDAAEYGAATGGGQSAQQLLYTAATVARGDEPTVPVSAGAAVPLRGGGSGSGSTTIARFTVTPVPEGSDAEKRRRKDGDRSGGDGGEGTTTTEQESTEETTISETCKEEMFLIGELTKMRPHEFEVSEEDEEEEEEETGGELHLLQLPAGGGGDSGRRKQSTTTTEASSTTTSCCSSSTVSTSNHCQFCTSGSPCVAPSSSGIASGNEQGSSTPRSGTAAAVPAIVGGGDGSGAGAHGIPSSTTSSITSSVSASSSSTTCPTNGTSSADALPHQQLSVSSTIKLYRKHRPSSQYQEYKV